MIRICGNVNNFYFTAHFKFFWMHILALHYRSSKLSILLYYEILLDCLWLEKVQLRLWCCNGTLLSLVLPCYPAVPFSVQQKSKIILICWTFANMGKYLPFICEENFLKHTAFQIKYIYVFCYRTLYLLNWNKSQSK